MSHITVPRIISTELESRINCREFACRHHHLGLHRACYRPALRRALRIMPAADGLATVFNIDGLGDHLAHWLSVKHLGRVAQVQRVVRDRLRFPCTAWEQAVRATHHSVYILKSSSLDSGSIW